MSVSDFALDDVVVLLGPEPDSVKFSFTPDLTEDHFRFKVILVDTFRRKSGDFEAFPGRADYVRSCDSRDEALGFLREKNTESVGPEAWYHASGRKQVL
jgi:hypothetical protein